MPGNNRHTAVRSYERFPPRVFIDCFKRHHNSEHEYNRQNGTVRTAVINRSASINMERVLPGMQAQRIKGSGLVWCPPGIKRSFSPPCITARRGGCVIKKNVAKPPKPTQPRRFSLCI